MLENPCLESAWDTFKTIDKSALIVLLFKLSKGWVMIWSIAVRSSVLSEMTVSLAYYYRLGTTD